MMTPVLIVGAGPTGLVLALWLSKKGVAVRIIDKIEKSATTSRALAVHARTLEFYRQLGIDHLVTEKGFHFPAVNLWVNHQHKARISLEDIGQGQTPFPYVYILPQDQHEDLLIAELKKNGVEVERKTELVAYEEKSDSVIAQLRLANGQIENVSTQYLAGCDGARSAVRHQMQVEFTGSTYPGWFYVADVEGTGPIFNRELHVSLDRAEFMAVFPLKTAGSARFIGVIREQDDDGKLTWQDVNQRVIHELTTDVKHVNWFSTYHVHHRVAEHFRKGRVFILGDASHIHSPVGGQGMNTGIGDAVNLAWKLAQVLNGPADETLLDSYETERIAFAKTLVQTTDRAFHFISSEGRLAQFVRTKLAPTIIPRVIRSFSASFFKSLSQTAINYRNCSLNQGRAGALHGGDRLPWIASVDNFAPLKNLSWQIHIYGERQIKGSGVHQFPWHAEMAKKGLVRNAIYVIRPDGYIGFISRDEGEVDAYSRNHHGVISRPDPHLHSHS